jgi:hypothetical protein
MSHGVLIAIFALAGVLGFGLVAILPPMLRRLAVDDDQDKTAS